MLAVKPNLDAQDRPNNTLETLPLWRLKGMKRFRRLQTEKWSIPSYEVLEGAKSFFSFIFYGNANCKYFQSHK